MELLQLKNDFNVCKIASVSQVDLASEFTFLSITNDEISLVCDVANTPADATDIEPGWKGLKISGMLDFGLIGILAGISGILAEREIGIFVVSTFNTDYILLKSENLDKAITALRDNGYSVV